MWNGVEDRHGKLYSCEHVVTYVRTICLLAASVTKTCIEYHEWKMIDQVCEEPVETLELQEFKGMDLFYVQTKKYARVQSSYWKNVKRCWRSSWKIVQLRTCGHLRKNNLFTGCFRDQDMYRISWGKADCVWTGHLPMEKPPKELTKPTEKPTDGKPTQKPTDKQKQKQPELDRSSKALWISPADFKTKTRKRVWP